MLIERTVTSVTAVVELQRKCRRGIYKSIRMKRSLTFLFLYYWTKLICINPLTLTDTKQLRFSYYSIMYSTFLTLSYSYIWYYTMSHRLKILLPGETPIIEIAIFIAMANELLEAVHASFIFGFHQNRFKLIVKSIAKAEKTSKKLDILIDYKKCFRKLAICQTVVTIAHISWMMLDSLPLISNTNFNVFISLYCILAVTAAFNRLTIFVWTIAIVKQTFQRLNDKARFPMQNHCDKMTGDNRVSSRLIMSSECRSNFLADKITLIAKLHRQLRDIIYRTVKHIAGCVLSTILTQFLNMTISVHIFYRFLKEYKEIGGSDVRYLAVISLWTLIPIGLLTVISNVCGSTTDEANKTVKILHAVVNDIDNFHVTQETAKFNALFLDLLQNPLRISVLGFFDLDYYLIYRAITTSTTLLTIILQFYN